MKNLIVCCDGTANEFARNRTNVIKLFYALEVDPARQVAYYHPGLGTMEPPGALTDVAKRATKLLGMAFGYGLPADIRDAYVFIMTSFEPGDRLFLFGFSRGAYTVRAVASLLHMYGLLPRGNEPLVPYAIRMMTVDDRERFALAGQFKSTFATECKPWFVGVWDTVSSVGWFGHPLALPYTAYNADIGAIRHAISIDEQRAFFRQNLWHTAAPSAAAGPQDVKQVWFPGVHCDVGGGYPESECGLSKIALEWMLAEAQACGLRLNRNRTELVLGAGDGHAPPDANAAMHQSLTPNWWPAEFVPKRHYNSETRLRTWRMNLFRRRAIPPNSAIHESAFQRPAHYQRLLPQDCVKVSTRGLTW